MAHQAFIARRIKQLRAHIKTMHAHEGLTPYVRDLLSALACLLTQAHA